MPDPYFAKIGLTIMQILAAVNEELQRLQYAGIIKPVRNSNWAALFPVVKRNGKIRL